MRAIRVAAYGGPEVLQPIDLPAPRPGPGELLVRVEAAGVNFIDVYQRTGLYPGPLPFVPGEEGAGVIDALGEGVSGFRIGERVAWAMVRGAYAEHALVGADRAIAVPETVGPRLAAALMLQGMTAHYLCTSTYPLKAGDTCLVHAAAGGVGLLLVQMARRRGARVIGTVSTPEKAHLAREVGADDVILYTEVAFAEAVRELTGGRGVEVVYDSVGRATAEGSLASLAPRGMLVFYGNSSGPAPAIDPLNLTRRGSLFLTRPSLAHYVADRPSLEARAGEVLGEAAAGRLRVRIHRTYPLADAAQAHRDLEERRSSGKLLLVP